MQEQIFVVTSSLHGCSDAVGSGTKRDDGMLHPGYTIQGE
jgi:hypothetical protein